MGCYKIVYISVNGTTFLSNKIFWVTYNILKKVFFSIHRTRKIARRSFSAISTKKKKKKKKAIPPGTNRVFSRRVGKAALSASGEQGVVPLGTGVQGPRDSYEIVSCSSSKEEATGKQALLQMQTVHRDLPSSNHRPLYHHSRVSENYTWV